MTDADLVLACPACDSTDLYKRQNRFQDADRDFRCEQCGERFDHAVEREPHHPGAGPNPGTDASLLANADPGDWP